MASSKETTRLRTMSEPDLKIHNAMMKNLQELFLAGKPAPNQKLLQEIVEKAQKQAGDRIYKDSEKSETLLSALGEEIRTACKLGPAAIVPGPLKLRVRAEEKIKLDYGGDWYQLKDVVRMTIVAPTAKDAKAAAVYIRTQACVASKGRGLPKAEPDDDVLKPTKCGYTGYNYVALLENGRFGEIQLNVPEVMYGQMGAETFEKIVGDKNAAKKYKDKYKVDGGLGHIFYELYRPDTSTPIAEASRVISVKYFDHLRDEKADAKAGEKLQEELKRYMETYKAEIHKLHEKKEAAKKQAD